MRPISRLGLVVVVALAIIALGGATSASATVLCGNAEEECKHLATFPSGTALIAKSINVVFETNITSITCEGSTLESKTTAKEGKPLPGQIGGLSFAACKASGGACTVTTLDLPYKDTIEWTKEDDGALTASSSGKGSPAVTAKCGFLINCTFSSKELALDAKGGNPGTVVATKEALEMEGGLCPKEASLTATYTISVPQPVHVAKKGKGIKMCKAEPKEEEGTLVCPKGEGFSGKITGELKKEAVAEFKSSEGTVFCTEETLEGELAENGVGSLTSRSYHSGKGGPCTSTLAENPTVEVEPESFPYEIEAFYQQVAAPQGLLLNKAVGRIKVLKIQGQKCIYLTTRSEWHLANPDTWQVLDDWELISGKVPPCPATFTEEGTVLILGQSPKVAER